MAKVKLSYPLLSPPPRKDSHWIRIQQSPDNTRFFPFTQIRIRLHKGKVSAFFFIIYLFFSPFSPSPLSPVPTPRFYACKEPVNSLPGSFRYSATAIFFWFTTNHVANFLADRLPIPFPSAWTVDSEPHARLIASRSCLMGSTSSGVFLLKWVFFCFFVFVFLFGWEKYGDGVLFFFLVEAGFWCCVVVKLLFLFSGIVLGVLSPVCYGLAILRCFGCGFVRVLKRWFMY